MTDHRRILGVWRSVSPTIGDGPPRPASPRLRSPRVLSVKRDELLQRLLHVSLDGAGRRRTHRAEQRTSAQLDAQAQGGPAFGGPHGESDAVFRAALAGP